MKTDEDNCWYSGRHEFCKETYPGQYEWCSAEYHRCVECADDAHCPPERPWCDWDMECEECLVSAHCSTGESCLMRSGRWVCRRKDCVDHREEGNPDYCANNFKNTPICDTDKRTCVECIHPSDCEGERETCIDSICVDESEMDCMGQIEAGFLNYCEVTSPERPVCHTRLRECVECQFENQCTTPDHTCVGTKCIPKEWECEVPEDCISDMYKCVEHECIKKNCSDYDDPDAYCDEKRGSGWRCLIRTRACVRCIDDPDCLNVNKKCVHYKCVDKKKKDECTEPDYPEQFCIREYGRGWVCKDGRCIFEEEELKKCSDFLSTREADGYCAGLNPEKQHCDFETGKCEECNLPQHCPAFWSCWNHSCRECFNDDDCDSMHPRGTYKCTQDPEWKCVKKTCDDAKDPDDYCRSEYGPGYECQAGICMLDDCGGIDNRCPEGLYCPERECVWGCRDKGNCPEAKPYCSAEGSCVECIGPVHCGLGYDCTDYECVKRESCMRQDSLCPQNQYCNIDICEEGCRDNRNCAEDTPHCSQKTGKCEECVFDKHCDEGYDCDDYKCVWVGFDCVYDPECPENWFCYERHFCVFGCNLSDENCGKDTPHCSQKTGKCEECWSDEHCDGGNYQECNENYRCVARKDNEECKPGDKKHGQRCRDGIWIDLECKGPNDCKGHEYCDDGICRDKQHECEVNSECLSGFYCETENKTFVCQEQICRRHEDCPTGQGCDYEEIGWRDRDNAKTSCISWREFYCSDTDPCPEGWACDRGSGKCTEAICGEGRPCQDGRYVCKDFECVPRSCEDRPDPTGYCMEQKGWYGRCLEGVCAVLACSFYPDPDMMCQETEGENWRCVGDRCLDFGAGGGGDPKQYCSEILGIDEAYWDFDKHECAVPDCDMVVDPDKLCAQLKDPSYTCREGKCRHGREGEECERREECISGLRCAGGICIGKECLRWQDCNDPEKWCNHGVCELLRTDCEDQSDCRDDYHCDAGGQCVPNDCEDHYDCGEGECCSGSKECVRCETLTCWYNFHCRQGWHCNQTINKCQRVGCERQSDCEEGYYCDMDVGICKKIKEGEGICWNDDDCPHDFVCKGVRKAEWELEGWPFSPYRKKKPGICVDRRTEVITIKGIDDETTCDYCRDMWTRAFVEGTVSLPPYHEHCRCWATYAD